jgi:hypothetical protein
VVQVDVDARVDHQAHAAGVGGGADLREPFGLAFGVDQATRPVVRVLEVAADGAGLQQPLHDLRRRQAVAGLQVGGDRHGADRGNARHGRKHLGGRRGLPVGIPQAPGDRAAGGGDGREPGTLQHLRAGRVPGVGQQQRALAAVQLGQHLGPLGQHLHVSNHPCLLLPRA